MSRAIEPLCNFLSIPRGFPVTGHRQKNHSSTTPKIPENPHKKPHRKQKCPQTLIKTQSEALQRANREPFSVDVLKHST
jgi:hypothetical protein